MMSVIVEVLDPAGHPSVLDVAAARTVDHRDLAQLALDQLGVPRAATRRTQSKPRAPGRRCGRWLLTNSSSSGWRSSSSAAAAGHVAGPRADRQVDPDRAPQALPGPEQRLDRLRVRTMRRARGSNAAPSASARARPGLSGARGAADLLLEGRNRASTREPCRFRGAGRRRSRLESSATFKNTWRASVFIAIVLKCATVRGAGASTTGRPGRLRLLARRTADDRDETRRMAARHRRQPRARPQHGGAPARHGFDVIVTYRDNADAAAEVVSRNPGGRVTRQRAEARPRRRRDLRRVRRGAEDGARDDLRTLALRRPGEQRRLRRPCRAARDERGAVRRADERARQGGAVPDPGPRAAARGRWPHLERLDRADADHPAGLRRLRGHEGRGGDDERVPGQGARGTADSGER